jgi:hypothetical protein
MTQVAFSGQNCALPFWNPGRNTRVSRVQPYTHYSKAILTSNDKVGQLMFWNGKPLHLKTITTMQEKIMKTCNNNKWIMTGWYDKHTLYNIGSHLLALDSHKIIMIGLGSVTSYFMVLKCKITSEIILFVFDFELRWLGKITSVV